MSLGAVEINLAHLLPKAIAWAEAQARWIGDHGQPLFAGQTELARSVGVTHPERIRIALVSAIPQPDDPALRQAAAALGMLGANTAGLTLGYGIFICTELSNRLLSHECRHVHQYEQAGSIAAFLHSYLLQLVEYGYRQAPLEVDARAHER
ncbi:MAG: hypothetical protein KDI71_08930 [Xanthomonadales bacterium]|nr:hypothetical protein [Xanthomonadales bacterium]